MDSSLVYLRELSGTLFRYHQENFLCDVVIVTAEQSEVRAHSVVLASVSSKLRAAFEQSNSANVKKNYLFRLHLAECEASVLEILLQYIYTGTIMLYSQLTMDIINSVILASQKLGLDMTSIETCTGVMLQLARITSEDFGDWKETLENEEVFVEIVETDNDFAHSRTPGSGHSQDVLQVASKDEGSNDKASSHQPESLEHRSVADGKKLYEQEERIAELETELNLLRDLLADAQSKVKASDDESHKCEGTKEKKRKTGEEAASSTQDDIWQLLSDVQTLMQLSKSRSQLWSLLGLRIEKGIILYKNSDEDDECLRDILKTYSSVNKDASSLTTGTKVVDLMNYGFAKAPVMFTIDNIEKASAEAKRGLCAAVDDIRKEACPAVVLATTRNVHQLDASFLSKFNVFYCSI